MVLITGAGGGIGCELAKGFAKQGVRLILWDLNKQFNEKVEIACEELGAEVYKFLTSSIYQFLYKLC